MNDSKTTTTTTTYCQLKDYFCFVDAFPILPMSMFLSQSEYVDDFLQLLFEPDTQTKYDSLTQIDREPYTSTELETLINHRLAKKSKCFDENDMKQKEWEDSLESTKGFWIVCFYPLQISRRFHCSKDAKIFIMSVFQTLDVRLGPKSYAKNLESLCYKVDLPSGRVNFGEFMKVSTYTPIQQDAVCIYMNGVPLESNRFSVGFGPLESMNTKIVMPEDCQWREIFQDAWSISRKEIPRTKSGNIFKDSQLFQDSLRKNVFAYGVARPIFKKILCASHPARLVYIDYQGRAQHAFIWEQVRSDWLKKMLPLTLPVYQFDFCGSEQTTSELHLRPGTKFINVDRQTCGKFLYGVSEQDTITLTNINAKWRKAIANTSRIGHSCAMGCRFCFHQVQQTDYAEETQQLEALTKHSLKHADIGRLQCFYDRCDIWLDSLPRNEAESNDILARVYAYITSANIQIVRVSEQGCVCPIRNVDLKRGFWNLFSA